MTALTADRETRTRGQGRVASYPVAASETLYKGGLVAINSSGYAVSADDSAGLQVAGVATEQVDNSSGSNGDLWIEVEFLSFFRLAASSITQAMISDPVYVVDDQTVDDAAGTTNEIFVGYLIEFESSSVAWVFVPGFQATPDLSVNTNDLVDGAVTGAKLAATAIDATVIAGGSAGNHTVTGIATDDHLVAVLHLDLGGNNETDLTSEFSIDSADTIDNAGGTDTSSDTLLVIWINDS